MSKRTPDRERRILACLKAGTTRRAAAGANGINEETLRLWMRDDLEFLAQVLQAESAAEEAMTRALTRAAAKSWGAALTWLERRRGPDWGKVDRLEITLKHEAQQIADELGMDVSEVMAELDDVLKVGRDR